jgi:hypothetical protein
VAQVLHEVYVPPAWALPCPRRCGTLSDMTLAAGERVLLATKLHPPVPRRLVPRPRLMELLRPTE